MPNLRSTGLFPIGEECVQSFVRQWMFCELRQHLERNRRDIRTRECTLDDVHRMPDGCREHFRGKPLIAIDLYDVQN